jgi:3-dehydroquinate dehydratase II
MSIRIAIINGPNLNLLGKRETKIYGGQSFETYFEELERSFPDFNLTYFQSNVEGELVDMIQKEGFESAGIILNAAAYSHTSIAIADAVAAVPINVVGVHISNIFQREHERHVDLLAKACVACLFGFGLEGYRLALEYFKNTKPNLNV